MVKTENQVLPGPNRVIKNEWVKNIVKNSISKKIVLDTIAYQDLNPKQSFWVGRKKKISKY